MGQQLHLEQVLFSCYSENKPAWENMQSKSLRMGLSFKDQHLRTFLLNTYLFM